MGKPMYNSPDS